MNDRKRLYVDMDGTIARFHDEVNYLEQMFEKGFYRNLKPFDNAITGIRQLIRENSNVEVFILSAAVEGEPPYCTIEKNEWLDVFMPEVDSSHRIFTKVGVPKSEYIEGGIKKSDYLLDDYNKNLREWEAEGGRAIKCKNNINHRGLGAYGGEKGELWQGAVADNMHSSEEFNSELELLINTELTEEQFMQLQKLKTIQAECKTAALCGDGQLTYLSSDENALTAVRLGLPVGFRTSYEGYHGSDEGMHRFHIANSEAVFWAYKQDDSYEDKAAFHFALSEADITFLKEYISESEINKTQLAEAYKPFPKDKLMPGKEISLEQYEDMYNTLPPVPLKSSLFANGFQSSEQYSYKTNPETGNDEPTYMTFVKADGKAYYAGDNFMGRISEDNAEAVLSNLCRDEIEAEAVVEEAEACEM